MKFVYYFSPDKENLNPASRVKSKNNSKKVRAARLAKNELKNKVQTPTVSKKLIKRKVKI